MIILVNGATATFSRYRGHPSLGRLVGPRGWNAMDAVAAADCPWAADNDAFLAWDEDRFVAMIRTISVTDREKFLWVASPDVVGDAAATIDRWHLWYPIIRDYGLPAAFVGQDGLASESGRIPWGELDAFFIGGSTEWKLSAEAEGFGREAKSRGKWLHMGRVNSKRRIRHAWEIGCDSVDGTAFSKWPDKFFASGVRWLREIESQPVLF